VCDAARRDIGLFWIRPAGSAGLPRGPAKIFIGFPEVEVGEAVVAAAEWHIYN
jgi:hypothetical protein